jgi:hypothetical protein
MLPDSAHNEQDGKKFREPPIFIQLAAGAGR